MSNKFHFYIHFPSGHQMYIYENVQYHIGDKIIFEGESGGWIIDDIQHQFREGMYVMTNIIVSPWSV